MATNEASTGIARDLNAAIDELNSSLERASAAAATIRTLVPRIGAIGSVLDELETLIQSGRAQIGAQAPAASATYSRPTLVVPAAADEVRPQTDNDDWDAVASTGEATVSGPQTPPVADGAWATNGAEQSDGAAAAAPAASPDLLCFRLEFESRPGPLDLRTVDDAVSEHPAVRDVALLDYDGRKATLKVWITSEASPADVQQALSERASMLFDPGNDVTIVALEDVA